MVVNDADEIAERRETVNPTIGPADSAAVSVEGRVRQTDQDAASLS